jgi:tetratricopeptide (TPR) repeat protein/tRNA A-37 threonylcarbamoyl transferase component Bud32
MAADPRVEQLLEELLDSGHTPEEVCRACPELLPQVRERWQRLRVSDAEVDALFPPPGSTTPAAAGPPIAELPQVPGYELETVLGHGGVGIVYKARHLRLNRPVALKMLLAGAYARAEELERFLREAEAVAGLRHPNIVQVYDAGGQDGRPYFTMELIESGSLAQKAAGTPQPARQAAALLATLADAVQVAHAGGIVHRDLKPANILLAADGTPKIADFGLARRLEGGAGLTRSGTPMGTPSYMAPEQALGKTAALGPAVDIYALGAILYELLTGRPPFRGETAAETIQQVIAEEPVPPARLRAGLPRDLETICLKCLHKEPSGRYASAQALAEDLRRFDRGLPITARPASRLERLRRWARRRPAVAALSGALLAATLLLIASLLAGIVLTTDALDQARAAEQSALDQRVAAEKAAAAERDARQVAQKRLGQIEKAKDILASIFRDLNPRMEVKGGTPLLAQLGQRLDQAAVLLEGEAVGDPLLVARLQVELGTVQVALGYPKRAITLFSKAHQVLEAQLGADHAETLAAVDGLAQAYSEAGRPAEALPLLTQALAKRQAHLGTDHPTTLSIMNNLAVAYQADNQLARAIPLFEQALAKQKARLGADHVDTLTTMSNLAVAYAAAGQPARAVPLFEEALAAQKVRLGAGHAETLATLSSLAAAYQADGQLARALPLFEQALAGQKAKLGTDHADTLGTMADLATAYQASGQPARAVPMLEYVVQKREEQVGPNNAATLSAQLNLGEAYAVVGKTEAAWPLFAQVLDRSQTHLGPGHRITLAVRKQLAATYKAAGQLTKAVPHFEQALEQYQTYLGPDHPETLKIANDLALAYLSLAQWTKAVPLLERTVKQMQDRLGADDPTTNKTMANLAMAYLVTGQTGKAVPLLEAVLAKTTAQLGPDHQESLRLASSLAEACRACGQVSRALEVWEQTMPRLQSLLGPDHPDTLRGVSSLALTYFQLGRLSEAEPLLALWLAKQRPKLSADDLDVALRLKLLGQCQGIQKHYAAAEQSLRESLAISRKKQPLSILRYDTETLLGAALVGQRRYGSAEPLLLSGARFFKARVASLAPAQRRFLFDAVNRLIELYDAWGRPEDAARWRQELAALYKSG